MKKNAVLVVALSGLASGAIAQSLSINVQLGDTWIGVGETTTATMTATFTGEGTPYMSVADFHLTAISGAGNFTFSNLTLGGWNMNALGPATGTIDGSGISDIHLSQQALFGAVDTTHTGLLIATWTIRRDTTLGARYRITATDAPFTFGINDAENALGFPTIYGPEVMADLVFPGIPAPSGIALLGLSGMICVRRRRN